MAYVLAGKHLLVPAESFVVMLLRERLAGRIGCDVLCLFDTSDVRGTVLATDGLVRQLDEDTLDECGD